jgi:starch synthase
VNILLVSAEVDPYAKVGGLADVASALPKALHRLGHDVRVIMPRYQRIDQHGTLMETRVVPFEHRIGDETWTVSMAEAVPRRGVPIYFVDVVGMFSDRPEVYGAPDDGRRFLSFCSAMLVCVERLGWRPDVVHANDWHTAIVPVLMREQSGDAFLGSAASLMTIHNLTYQGVLDRTALGGMESLLPASVHETWVNIMALGLLNADVLTTVSPTYAREILTPEFGVGLDGVLRSREAQLFGVLNGIDTDLLDPAHDPHIAANYTAHDLHGKALCKRALQESAGFALDPAVPLLGMIGRLVDQKGIDLFAAAVEPMLHHTDLQIVVLGTGAQHYIDLLRSLEERWPGRVKAWLGFHATDPELIYAGADFFLMPSRFEPCGLGQMIAMRYGTIPIVRATGGLLDTVREGTPHDPGVGFVFWPYDAAHLEAAVHRALNTYRHPDRWRTLIRNAMTTDHSWGRSAQRYVELYTLASERHQEAGGRRH